MNNIFKNLFSYKGRFTGGQYFLYGVIAPFVVIVIGYAVVKMLLGDSELEDSKMGFYLFSLFGLLGVSVYLSSILKRARDIKTNTTLISIAMFIPYINIIALLVLLFAGSKNDTIVKNDNIEVTKIAHKNDYIYQIKNNTFENVKESLIKEFEALGYKEADSSPNMLKLTAKKSYVQLKHNTGKNDLTLMTSNVETPSIVKRLIS